LRPRTLTELKLQRLKALRDLRITQATRLAQATNRWACERPDCDGKPHGTWTWPHARANQRTPPGDWYAHLILAGRGWGKTRTAAEDLRAYALAHPGARIAVVAPTFADARDTCVEGVTGLLATLGPQVVRDWNRSIGELVLVNGTRFRLFSADKPDRLRGPAHHRAWVDELAAGRYPRDTWDQLMFGLRLGERPQAIVTTTPRPINLLRELLDTPGVHVTRGRTLDNAANLPRSTLDTLLRTYAGTRLGRQELDAEILDDTPGALWRRAWLETSRRASHPELVRVIVTVDPAVTDTDTSDETGIIVAGLGIDGDAYLLADRTCRTTPAGWGKRAVQAAADYHAGMILYEGNQGGDAIGHVLRGALAASGNPDRIRLRKVTAAQSKADRALPVAGLYEQGRVHHVGALPELEDQQVTWTPEDGTSPDRLDACVHAVTHLLLGPRPARSRFFA